MIRAFIASFAFLVPAAAHAQDSATEQVQRVVACRGIADDAERLACYDREAGVLGEAIETDEVVIVSKEQAKAAQRDLFGFSTPNFAGLLGKDEEVDEIELTIRRAQYNNFDKLVIEGEDGSVWLQIDDRRVGSAPKSGTEVLVERATLGSFELKIPGRRSMKVRRLR